MTGKNKEGRSSQQQVHLKKAEFYQGIIPHPEAMQSYENIQPGFADRILSITEGEVKHRQKAENKIISFSFWTSLVGLMFAIISVLVVCALCYYAFSLGYPDQAKWIAISVLVGIASVFVYKTRGTRNSS